MASWNTWSVPKGLTQPRSALGPSPRQSLLCSINTVTNESRDKVGRVTPCARSGEPICNGIRRVRSDAPYLLFMKILKRSAVLLLLVGAQLTVFAQYELAISVRGLNCSTNAGRQVLSKPITEQTLLADGAANQGIADLSSVALVYHEQGPGYDSTSADSIDLVNASTGAPIFTLFGLFFGDSTNLNRVAITNAANTMVKRVDYIYTTQNSHSMGAAFVTKQIGRASC